jgi:hypothetical protein
VALSNGAPRYAPRREMLLERRPAGVKHDDFAAAGAPAPSLSFSAPSDVTRAIGETYKKPAATQKEEFLTSPPDAF